MILEELRIGNWVRHLSGWSYRKGNDPSIEFDFQWDESDWYALGDCTLSWDLIEPIPLTIKKLKEFGLTQEYNKDFRFGDNVWTKGRVIDGVVSISIVLEIINGTIYFTDYRVKLEYIHQLQNLYYELTREEI